MLPKEQVKFYASAYLVLTKDDHVLLSRRANTGYQDGMYSLVAGHFEGGETSKQCIIREAREEAGIILKSEDLKVSYFLHRLAPTREYFDVFLTAERWEGDITNMELNKCDELKWFRMDNLPETTIPEVRQAVGDIKKGISFGEIGW